VYLVIRGEERKRGTDRQNETLTERESKRIREMGRDRKREAMVERVRER
jgi:hypothetical protein